MIILKQSAQNYSNLLVSNVLESITDAFYALDQDWSLVYINKAAERLLLSKRKALGYTRQEILGRNFWQVFPGYRDTSAWDIYRECMYNKTPAHFEMRDVDCKIDIEVHAYPCETGISVYLSDITGRKESEARQRQSENLFAKAFQLNPNPSAIWTYPDGRFIDVNDSFLKLHGYSREEVIGHSCHELPHWPDAEERDRLVELLEKGIKVHNVEIDLLTKAGERLKGLYSLERINIDGEQCFFGCFTNLTDKIKLEKEMARLDRLNLVGEMSASIGHEIRNPMTTVKGFLQLLHNEEKDDRKREYFELMVDELDRANSIITEFLSLAKDRRVKFTTVSLNRVLDSLFPLMNADAIKQGKCIILHKGDIPKLYLNEKEIRQLVINLVKNGLDFTPGGGTVTVRTYSECGGVTLSVEDEGPGIDPAIMDKLGTPFFTTKEDGTGLGLAVCYSIASRHNAAIDIKTSMQGTVFYVRFYAK